jgi:outer membrane receptor for ferric coprogen and ferric-rhodotorulic acid
MLRPFLPTLAAALVLGLPTTVMAADDQPASGSMTLGNVNINADAGVAGTAMTENSGSYTTGSMSTATKLPLSIRETPQSVSVITRQRMDDQGMNDLNDVVKYAPGLTLKKFGSDRQSFLARGFQIDNIMYDGLPTSLGVYTQDIISSADLAMLDRVEVVRGATGLMTGAGSPSATLNLVRKRPTADPQVSITTSAGSWDRYRTEVDASNRLNESGSIRGRVVAAYQDDKGYVDVRESQRQTFYGIIEADLNESTTWTIGASKQRQDATSDWGALPSGPNGEDLHLKRSTFLSGDWAYWDKDNYTLFTDITHRFDNGWTLKLAAQRIWAKAFTYASYPYVTETEVTEYAGKYDDTDYQTNLDATMSGSFQLMGREHELSFGTSYRKDVFDQWGGGGAFAVIDPYNPTNDFPKVDVDMTAWNYRNTAVEKSVYGVARFNPIDPLHVILGARVMWYDWNDRVNPSDYNVTQKVTPYAGVIYDLNDTYSVYASYTQIFKPQSGQTVDGSALDPMTGENYEIGLKGEYFNGALNASVALFDMTQEKRAYTTDERCGIVSCSATAGEVRSQGIDTELTGALTPNWQFSTSYTYVYSQYTKDANNEGRLFAPEQPKHLFKTATTYNFTGDLNKLRIGADVYAQSKTFTDAGTGTANQDAYAVVGLMAGYKFDENWDGRVNVNNVLDERYWQGIPNTYGGGTYGDPRNVMFSLKWSL